MSGDKYQAALDAAAKQLSYRALSSRQLLDRLARKGHDGEAAGYAVEWLAGRGLLDDAAYAESVVRGYAQKGYGAMRIRQELAARGIDRATADNALQSFAPDRARMLALLDKRLRGDVSDRREVGRAAAALQRRGFSWGEIRDALEAYGGQLPEEPD